MTKFGEWQPIETAPKDGRDIIVFRPTAKETDTYIPRVGTDYRWSRFKFSKWARSNEDTQPTHWMPLPEPPQ